MVRFTEFGGAVPRRPAEDQAFSVARFIQNGGSFVNYYMVGWLSPLLSLSIVVIFPLLYTTNIIQVIVHVVEL